MNEKSNSHADTRARRRARLNVLIACEESQAECMAFRNLGHNAFSCDIQKCRYNPDWHILGDVTPLLQGKTKFTTQSGVQMSVPGWDLIICHPPCTYLCKVSSVQLISHKLEKPKGDSWYYSNELDAWVNSDRYRELRRSRDFFMLCLNAQAPYVAVENPLPMAIAKLPKPTCFICPSWFGVKYTKKTLYWLKNLPPIVASLDYPNPKSFVRSSRGKYRSRTFPQLANAIARQWSEYIIEDMAKKLQSSSLAAQHQ